MGVSPGHATVHVRYVDGSGSSSGEVEVVVCEDAGSDAALDGADDS
ncbi:MAG: hypothetical protein ACXWUG_10705 [Polyangiales bacterium]